MPTGRLSALGIKPNTLRLEVEHPIQYTMLTPSIFSGGEFVCSTTCLKGTLCLHALIDHQTQPEAAASGGGEQGTNKTRDDPLLNHCGVLAHQQLGVVPSLTALPWYRVCVCACACACVCVRTLSYSKCQKCASCLLHLFRLQACAQYNVLYFFIVYMSTLFFTYVFLNHIILYVV